MPNKLSIQIFLLSLFFFSSDSKADIWVLDINDTITLRNDVDPEKTVQVVNYQLVAQNLFLNGPERISIEQYIKKTIEDKSMQRLSYGSLPIYAKCLHAEGLISDEVLAQIPLLSQTYKQALEVANHEENGGFFPSLFKLIDFILEVDQSPSISIQSFGNEIPFALEVIAKRYGHRLNVMQEIGMFDEQHHLDLGGRKHRGQQELVKLLAPGTVSGWKNNYKAGGGKYLFFSEDNDNLVRSHFFDDNASQFVRAYINGRLLSKEESLTLFERYIYNVDTALALTEADYFINAYRERRLL